MATQQQIDALRSDQSKTGFRYVYRLKRRALKKNGDAVAVYQARVWRERASLGYFVDPETAAAAVADHFSSVYGPNWAEITWTRSKDLTYQFCMRKAPLCKVIRDPAGDDGFIIITYLTGVRRAIQPQGRRETFATEEEAEAYFDRWLAKAAKATPGILLQSAIELRRRKRKLNN